MNTTDLWGAPIVAVEPVAFPTRPRHKTTPRGYAAAPGSGPAGETCRTCAHYCHRESGKYRKCGLVEARWTRGPGTDILARAPACEMWKAKEERRASSSPNNRSEPTARTAS